VKYILWQVAMILILVLICAALIRLGIMLVRAINKYMHEIKNEKH